MYTTKLFRSISEIPSEKWDAVSGGQELARSHAYLLAVERASVNDAQYFYPVVFDNEEIVAHCCVYTISTDFRQMLPRFAQSLVTLCRRIFNDFLIIRVTECCSPLVADHSMSTIDDPTRPALIARLGQAIEDLARQENSPLIVIRDFLQEDREIFDVLRQQGFNVVSNMPLARIRVRWDSYDNYLSAMRSRYRKDVKRRLRRAERTGQKVRRIENFGDLASTWVKQAAVVFENTKGFKREQLARSYYENVNSELPQQSELLAIERDGALVAHGMLVNDEKNTTATYFGRDPGKPNSEWFQLMNEVIRIGIDRKSKYINLGLGSYDAKANVGADVEPLFVYSKSRYRLINGLMKLVPRTMDCRSSPTKRVFHDS
ncbi:MAG: GNAT family N-acetyltransferase [Gammaproteobacteria bacterium]